MGKNTYSLETIRHSAAHILAQAVQKRYPEAKLGIGPAIDDGFYYDFDLPVTLNDEDLQAIEDDMNVIIKEKQAFKQYDLNKEEAIQKLKDANQDYKLELIDDLNLDTYSFYENGPFVDLCKGPHVGNTIQVPVIKLLKVSGAYWRGSEKNKMLQRIYGTAFADKKELKTYLRQLEEAKKRDHRLLGKELKLFSIQESIGAGLVLWHPKGALIRHLIEDLWKKEHFKSDYQLLYSPHVGKSHLWEKSGHLDCYNENMYNSIDVENQDYFIKPMNCPFHIEVYKDDHHSYRELPIRYAELGTVYRYERSGVLHGLMRVRGFTQDDAHIICTKEQVKDEVKSVLAFCVRMLGLFGFKDVKTFISTKPSEKAVGEDNDWAMAEESLTEAVKEAGIDYEIDEGGGAFYGPKIDIKIKDAIGREWQCSTIQFDFNLPERFDMTFVNSNGEKERPIMIHRALLGSLERFFGVLIEHYAGKFPTWLSPVQVKVLSIAEKFSPYVESVSKCLKEAGFRVELDTSSEKIGYKIRQSIKEKVPYLLVIGEKEVESQTVAIRSRDYGDLGTKTINDFIHYLQTNENLSQVDC